MSLPKARKAGKRDAAPAAAVEAGVGSEIRGFGPPHLLGRISAWYAAEKRGFIERTTTLPGRRWPNVEHYIFFPENVAGLNTSGIKVDGAVDFSFGGRDKSGRWRALTVAPLSAAAAAKFEDGAPAHLAHNFDKGERPAAVKNGKSEAQAAPVAKKAKTPTPSPEPEADDGAADGNEIATKIKKNAEKFRALSTEEQVSKGIDLRDSVKDLDCNGQGFQAEKWLVKLAAVMGDPRSEATDTEASDSQVQKGLRKASLKILGHIQAGDAALMARVLPCIQHLQQKIVRFERASGKEVSEAATSGKQWQVLKESLAGLMSSGGGPAGKKRRVA